MATTFEPDLISCATCGVETAAPLPDTCPICADERQWVPATGQAWTTQADLAARSVVTLGQVDERQWSVTACDVGIGQTMQVIRTSDGVVLWDPIGLVDRDAVGFIESLGPVIAVVASHPHMYGAQVAWSRALNDAPVLISRPDAGWVQRGDDRLVEIEGAHRLAEDAEIVTLGGHFAGSLVLHWTSGADGRGVLLVGDTIMANPDRSSVSFMRSYPNRIPLSGSTVERMLATLGDRGYSRLWSNFANAITEDADRVVAASAARHIGWVTGAFDDAT